MGAGMTKVALYLDCRTCVEQKLPLRTRSGITQMAEIEIECGLHGHIATFKLGDQDTANFAIELLAKGCESCRKGVAHVH